MSTIKTDTPSSEATFRCPMDYALGIIGDRWSMLLVRDILVRGKRRYSDFLGSPEGISTNILASRLKQMQQNGLLEKFPDPSDRKASIYLLTNKGIGLAPVMLEVIRWGLANDEYSAVPEMMSKALSNTHEVFVDSLTKSIAAERAALR